MTAAHPLTKRLLTAGLALCLLAGMARAAADLPAEFVTPPDAAKPWVFMWWFDTITPADITGHMEELKSKGVGGVLLFPVSDMCGKPAVPYMSDAWRALFRHTAQEADRLGLKMGVNICAGWPSGGPWITPENSSWMAVSSATIVRGPQKFSGKLADPTGRGKLYADVAVQAYPIPEEISRPIPAITSNSNPGQLPNLLDGNYNTVWNSGTARKPWLLVDFGAPHPVDWIWIDVTGRLTIEASDDGVTFKRVTELLGPQWVLGYEAVPATTARWFRISVPNNQAVHDFALGTRAEVERAARLAAKRALTHPFGVTTTRLADQVRFVREDLSALPSDRPLKTGDMVDLSTRMTPEGTLDWEVPAGTWKIVRIGRTTTGIAAGGGLLPDYLSPLASEQNYAGYKPLLSDADTLVGRTFQYFHEDNVEIDGIYSWTPRLLDEFRQRRGYDPTRYLATMAGEIVDNVEVTDRFLTDARRTIADCVADGHYGRWAELAHADGMRVRAEAGGQHHPRLLCNDGLMNQGRMDTPVAEFWESTHWKENQWVPANHHDVTLPGWDEAAQNVNAKQAASAAHLYGKPLVASEAFTSIGPRSHWGVAPADLRLYANIAFCEGINALTIHGSATSGPAAGMPGKAFAAGTHFNPNTTWWNQAAAPFLQYLARCSHMLQQGHFVADVLYYNGDEAPNFVAPKHVDPSLGFGYDYDVCNSEILLTRLSVRDGRIVLPDGMSYRVLVLPDRPVMPLGVASKLAELIADGATVIGPKPQRTPGLTGYPESETALKGIADRVWGTPSANPTTDGSYGKGRVVWGMGIREYLTKSSLPPDFAFATESEDALIDFIHRRSGDTEIYFVANRRAASLRATCTFRVNGSPELWDPLTGEQRDLPQFESTEQRSSVPLELAPYGAVFVVFRKPSLGPDLRTIRLDPHDQAGNPSSPVNFPTLTPVQELAGPWTVQFDPQWFYPTEGLSESQAMGLMEFDKLEDWTKRDEPAVRNFSGTATYRKMFNYPAHSNFKSGNSDLKSEGPDVNSEASTVNSPQAPRLWLDLGAVKASARVKLNGQDLGVLWCAPWRVDITRAVKPGDNTLEIEVVNLWANRLTGDKNLPEGLRRTRTRIPRDWMANYQPASGLLGPVTLQSSRPAGAK